MKIITIVGTRPEVIRLSRIIAILDKFTEHVLVHTGQNHDYELNQIFFDDLEVRNPDYFLNAVGENLASTISKIIMKTDEIFENINPDALLILGDTNSGLSVIPAKRRKIPIFHMEAGNRCFDLRVPEEINRKIIDHTSDINMPYSAIARQYLIQEGFPPEQIIRTGSPLFEVLDFYKEKIDASVILNKLGLTPKKYFVVSCHREENVDSKESLKAIVEILNEISTNYNFPIIFSLHPRTRKRLDTFKFNLSSKIKLVKPLSFTDYIKLQKESYCVLSDSGSITEEASIVRFPAINLRDVNERPEGFEVGAVLMSGIDKQTVLDSIPIAVSTLTNEIVEDYNSPNVSEKVLKIVLSYTNYINRRVWRK